MSRKSKKAELWEELFKKHKISENVTKEGFFKITADQIKEMGMDPRLMVYFDEYSGLPEIFKKDNLSILSISKKEYMIGKFDLYAAIEYDEKTDPISIERTNLESLDPENLHNESAAVLFAFNSSLLKNALETDDLSFTIYGKMGLDELNFNVSTREIKEGKKGVHMIKISKSQIEIDAGFETDDKLYILEAKKRHVEEINLRQLYFPYRLWSKRVSKEVVPVFLVYTDSTFYIFVCKFEDPNNINSLKILSKSKYIVADERITMEDVDEIYFRNVPKTCTDVTFPQADSFKRIMELLQLLKEYEERSNEEITEYFQFNIRQTSYYVTAAMFLGLVQRNHGIVSLTDIGKKIMKLPYKQRHMEIFSLILKDNVFYESYEYIKTKNDIPPVDFVRDLIVKYHPPKNKTDSGTPKRRAQTVIAWLKWMLDLTE